MKYFLMVLLVAMIDINLFLGKPIEGVKVYLVEEISNELVCFQKVGKSGKFDFSDLDPANYRLYIEVPEYTVRSLDKKKKAKYETDILIAYNTPKKSWYWQRDDGFMSVNFANLRKLTEDNVTPVYKREVAICFKEVTIDDKKQKGLTWNEREEMDEKEKPMIMVARLSVFDDGGAVGGIITGLTQREFYNRTFKISVSDKNADDILIVKVADD